MVQIIEMTQAEQTEMYNKVSKKKLIEMLIEANRQLQAIIPTVKFDLSVVNRSKPKDTKQFLEIELLNANSTIELIKDLKSNNKKDYIQTIEDKTIS